MQDDTPPAPSVDGISPAPTPAQKSAAPPVPHPSLGLPLALLLAIIVIYVLPAIVLIAIFPTNDGSLSGIKMIGMFGYGIGLLVWGGLGFLALSRIGSVKDKPRMQRMAIVRLAIVEVPMVLVSIAVLVLINLPPRLLLDVIAPTSAADLVAPLAVTFGTDTASKIFTAAKLTPLRYEWDYNGDGVVDQETFDPQATFVFQQAGIYTVAARVTMTNGQTKKLSFRLIIPKSSFGVEPLSPVIDEPAKFSLEHLFPKTQDETVPKLSKARWDFDNDSSVDFETDGLTATNTYRKLGTITATVTVTLSNGTQYALQRTIQVVKPPLQPFPITMETEPATLLGSVPFGVLFILKTDEDIANVSWTFGDQKTGEGLRVAHVYNEVGNFTAVALARSQTGTVAKLSKLVRVTSPLEIGDLTFEGNPPVRNFAIQGEVPLTVDLTPVTAKPLISFSWDAPGASEVLTTDKTLKAIYRKEGKYSIDLIGIDPDQNVLRKRISVEVKPASSVVQFTMDPPTPIAPALVKFDASDTFVHPGEEITGFEWDFGDGQNVGIGDKTKFSGARIEHTYEKPGTYVITLNVRTTEGHVYTGKQTLVVRAPVIDVCFIPSRRTGKAPLGVRFDTSCSTGDFVSWTWDFGDNAQSDQQSPTHVFLQPGSFKVTLTAVDKDGLKSTKETTITVTAE